MFTIYLINTMYKIESKSYLNLFNLKIKYHILLNLLKNEPN
jgi:hypothetical protein